MWNAGNYLKNLKKKNIYIVCSEERVGEKVSWNLASYFLLALDDSYLDSLVVVNNNATGAFLHEKYPIISEEEFMDRFVGLSDFAIVESGKEKVINFLIQKKFVEKQHYMYLSDFLKIGLPQEDIKNDFEPPEINQMDVKITYACNFRCEYCYQADENGNHERTFLSKENAENLVRFVKRLDDIFYITLAGGEPFVYPELQYLVDNLTLLGSYVSIITNFSAPYEKIEKIILSARDKLATFNISIHLSQWKNMELFYEKLKRVNELIEAEHLPLKIRTTCVLTEENYHKLLEVDKKMKTYFPEVSFEIQRMYNNNVYTIYNDEIEEFMAKRGLDVPIEDANHIDFYGRRCWAGAKFFYIEVNGEVRRCYTHQFNDNAYVLGNLANVDEIRIFDEPKACLSIHKGNCVCYSNFVNFKHVTEITSGGKGIDELYTM